MTRTNQTCKRECLGGDDHATQSNAKSTKPRLTPPTACFELLCATLVEHVAEYLAVPDKLQLATCSRSLAKENLITTMTTNCGDCSNCTSDLQHLCDSSSERKWSAEAWTAVFKRFGHSVQDLSLVGCDGIALESFGSPEAALMLESIKSLRITKCKSLDEVSLATIVAQCKNLQEVHICDMPLSDAALSALIQNNCTSLRVLNVTGCHKLVGSALQYLVQTQVEEVILEGCHNIKVLEIEGMLKCCQSLKSFNVSYCHNLNDCVALAISKYSSQLEHLNLRYCYKLTDVGVGFICSTLTSLQSLDLSQCPRITDAAVCTIAKSLLRLKELKLSNCRHLTPSAIVANLTFVEIRNEDRVARVDVPKETCRKAVCGWEQSDQVGVFKRQAHMYRYPVIRQQR